MDLTQEEFDALWAYDVQISEEYAAQARADAEVLAEVKRMVSAEEFKEIMAILEDGGGDDFKIVNKPQGDPQDDGFSLGDVWVYQERSLDDCFSGTVALPLPAGNYFQFSFSD